MDYCRLLFSSELTWQLSMQQLEIKRLCAKERLRWFIPHCDSTAHDKFQKNFYWRLTIILYVLYLGSRRVHGSLRGHSTCQDEWTGTTITQTVVVWHHTCRRGSWGDTSRLWTLFGMCCYKPLWNQSWKGFCCDNLEIKTCCLLKLTEKGTFLPIYGKAYHELLFESVKTNKRGKVCSALIWARIALGFSPVHGLLFTI